MAKVISYTDLFDFSSEQGLKNAIKAINELGGAYERLIKLVEKEHGKLTAAQNKLSAQAKQMASDQSKLNISTQQGQKSLTDLAAKSEALFKTQQNLTQQTVRLTTVNEKLKAEQGTVIVQTKELNKLQAQEAQLRAKLTAANSQQAQTVANLKAELSQLNREKQRVAKQTLQNVSIYERETAKLAELQRQYKNVALQYGTNSKQARVLKKELDLLYGSIVKVEMAAGQGQRRVGNYNDALKGLTATTRQFLSAFGIVGGVTMLAYLIRDTFQLVKESESLNKALLLITDTTLQYRREVEYLTTLSNDYGVNLNLLTESYNKFFVATKQTNLEGEETQKIYSAVVKSLAAIGANSQDTERALRALGQMISKGKVQAEELRLQLGDALPRSFRIMADALGVTTSKLDAMLKRGEVMAEDALPKFARALEKAFGVEQLDRIETLRAAQTRLTNSWIIFVKSVEDGEGIIAKGFIGFVNGAAEALIALKNIDLVLSTMFKSFRNLSDTQIIRLIDAGMVTETGKAVKDLTKQIDSIPFEELAKNREQYRNQVISWLEAEGEKTMDAQRLFHAYFMNRKKEQDILTQSQDFFTLAQTNGIETFQEFQKVYGTSLSQLDNGNRILENVEEKYRKLAVATGLENKEIEEQIGLIPQLQKEIKDLEEARAKIYTEEDLRRNQVQIELLKEELKRVEGLAFEYQKLGQSINPQSVSVGADLTGVNNALGGLAPAFAPVTSPTSPIVTGFERFVGKLKDIFQSGFIEPIQSGLNSLTDIFAGFTERRIQEQEAILKGLEENYERDIELAEENVYAKEAIEKRFENEKKAIEKRIATEKARQARFDKAIAVFQSIVNTASAIAEALPNIPLSIAVGAAGALQTGAILAQPIPAYAKGTPREGHGGGPAVVGEKGSEMYVGPDGNIGFTPNKATLVDLPKGAHIINHVITRRIVEAASERNEESGKVLSEMAGTPINAGNIRQILEVSNMRESEWLAGQIDKSLKSLPVHVNKVSDGKLKTVIRKGNNTWDQVYNRENSYR